jgi:hypothetical protein
LGRRRLGALVCRVSGHVRRGQHLDAPRHGARFRPVPPDQRRADLQDLFFNEPWFLIEGLMFAALAWLNIGGTARRWWLATAAAATAILVVFGMLAATGVTGRLIIG